MDSLFGITFSRLFKLLKDNKFDISKNNYPLIFVLIILSLKNSFFYRKDLKKISRNCSKIKDPVFILGHWRSGTSFLHSLLIQDDQFNYPRIFEVIHPFSFLNLKENYMDQIKKREVEKRPMDNVKNDPFLPGEEEFALAAITLKSPLIGWSFQKQFDYYEQFLTLENISVEDRELWKNEYSAYLNKLSNKNNKQLILKSPSNTARIKFLLELYPNAKFINLHRHPIAVFKSTKKLHETAIKKANLQSVKNYDSVNRIISTYKKVYESYFNTIGLIPKNNFIDVSYEELEINPLDVITEIYNKLSIPNFESIRSDLIAYIDTLKDYQKNKFDNIDDDIKQKLISEWGKYYKKWGYKIE